MPEKNENLEKALTLYVNNKLDYLLLNPQLVYKAINEYKENSPYLRESTPRLMAMLHALSNLSDKFEDARITILKSHANEFNRILSQYKISLLLIETVNAYKESISQGILILRMNQIVSTLNSVRPNKLPLLNIRGICYGMATHLAFYNSNFRKITIDRIRAFNNIETDRFQKILEHIKTYNTNSVLIQTSKQITSRTGVFELGRLVSTVNTMNKTQVDQKLYRSYSPDCSIYLEISNELIAKELSVLINFLRSHYSSKQFSFDFIGMHAVNLNIKSDGTVEILDPNGTHIFSKDTQEIAIITSKILNPRKTPYNIYKFHLQLAFNPLTKQQLTFPKGHFQKLKNYFNENSSIDFKNYIRLWLEQSIIYGSYCDVMQLINHGAPVFSKAFHNPLNTALGLNRPTIGQNAYYTYIANNINKEDKQPYLLREFLLLLPKGNFNQLTTLMDLGLNPNIIYHKTPLLIHVLQKRLNPEPIALELIKKGANISAYDHKSLKSVQMIAYEKGLHNLLNTVINKKNYKHYENDYHIWQRILKKGPHLKGSEYLLMTKLICNGLYKNIFEAHNGITHFLEVDQHGLAIALARYCSYFERQANFKEVDKILKLAIDSGCTEIMDDIYLIRSELPKKTNYEKCIEQKNIHINHELGRSITDGKAQRANSLSKAIEEKFSKLCLENDYYSLNKLLVAGVTPSLKHLKKLHLDYYTSKNGISLLLGEAISFKELAPRAFKKSQKKSNNGYLPITNSLWPALCKPSSTNSNRNNSLSQPLLKNQY